MNNIEECDLNKSECGTPLISEKSNPSISPAAQSAMNEFIEDFQIGDLVEVASRTWPGINKQGGLAKITKINEDGTFGVSYIVVRGHERKVAKKYIRHASLGLESKRPLKQRDYYATSIYNQTKVNKKRNLECNNSKKRSKVSSCQQEQESTEEREQEEQKHQDQEEHQEEEELMMESSIDQLACVTPVEDTTSKESPYFTHPLNSTSNDNQNYKEKTACETFQVEQPIILDVKDFEEEVNQKNSQEEEEEEKEIPNLNNEMEQTGNQGNILELETKENDVEEEEEEQELPKSNSAQASDINLNQPNKEETQVHPPLPSNPPLPSIIHQQQIIIENENLIKKQNEERKLLLQEFELEEYRFNQKRNQVVNQKQLLLTIQKSRAIALHSIQVKEYKSYYPFVLYPNIPLVKTCF